MKSLISTLALLSCLSPVAAAESGAFVGFSYTESDFGGDDLTMRSLDLGYEHSFESGLRVSGSFEAGDGYITDLSGKMDVSSLGGTLEVAYDYEVTDRFTIAPFVSYSNQSLDIEGFGEAASAEGIEVGVEGAYDVNDNFTMYFKVSAAKYETTGPAHF